MVLMSYSCKSHARSVPGVTKKAARMVRVALPAEDTSVEFIVSGEAFKNFLGAFVVVSNPIKETENLVRVYGMYDPVDFLRIRHPTF